MVQIIWLNCLVFSIHGNSDVILMKPWSAVHTVVEESETIATVVHSPEWLRKAK